MTQGCGSSLGGCGCGGSNGAAAPWAGEGAAPASGLPSMTPELTAPREAGPVAQVNGVPLHEPGALLDDETLRQRACTELLRQAAQRAGLLPVGDAPSTDGAVSAMASDAIETLLARELVTPEPSLEALQRHYQAHRAQYAQGERLQLRHVLYAVTPGVDVQALRQRAEAQLLALRCADPDGLVFAEAARQWSNCPSGRIGGELGWLGKADCAEEFARDVFSHEGVGVLPRLVASRFGWHIVEVRAREAGITPPFDAVRAAVADALRRQAWITALRQYLRLLAGAARLDGVALESADTPLVQ